MFCKSCGNKIDDDSQFCSYCGTRQSEINKPAFVNNDGFVQEATKTVNVNVSFGRQTKTKANQESNEALIEPDYDPSYVKETEATVIGLILLVSSLLLLIFQPLLQTFYSSHFSALELMIKIYPTNIITIKKMKPANIKS